MNLIEKIKIIKAEDGTSLKPALAPMTFLNLYYFINPDLTLILNLLTMRKDIPTIKNHSM